MKTNNTPAWVDGKKIHEVLFCKDFLNEYPMISLNGTFCTVDGWVSDENLLKKQIYGFLKPYVSTGLPKKVSNLLEVLRMECCKEGLPLQTDRIHVANGTLFLDDTFTPEKEFCRNRLPVSYNPDAPEPVAWKAFLSQLLYPEDIPAIQEYFGYCLIASNKAQKMLFVIGKGGEGKSRLGLVAQALFGCNMKTGSIIKLAIRLNKLREKLISEVTPFNASKKMPEIKALAAKMIPTTEKLRTYMHRAGAAQKELEAQIAALEKEVDSRRVSVLEHLELRQQLQKMQALE